MSIQRVFLRLHTVGMLPAPVRRLLRRRTWVVETGVAAGLRLGFPQNLDYILGSSELPVQTAIVQYLSLGGVFYDVGANVGFFSLLAARRVGPSGFAYSFEPLAENARAIRKNAALNAFANLSVFEVAAGEKSRIGELLLTEWDGGSCLSDTEVAPVAPLSRRPVHVAALDDPSLLPAVEGMHGGVPGTRPQSLDTTTRSYLERQRVAGRIPHLSYSMTIGEGEPTTANLPPTTGEPAPSVTNTSHTPTRASADRPTTIDVTVTTLSQLLVSGTDSADALEAAAKALSGTQRPGNHHVTLQLDPPELGQLRLDIKMQHHEMTLRVAADTADVARLIESRLGELRDALATHGIRIDRSEVVVRSHGTENANPQSGQQA